MGFCSLRWMCCLLLVSAFGIPAFAEGSHDRTQFGHDVTVGSDEKVAEVTCFACSVRVRGRVDGDVTTFGGSVVVERDATVGGDTTAFGGDVRLDGARREPALLQKPCEDRGRVGVGDTAGGGGQLLAAELDQEVRHAGSRDST